MWLYLQLILTGISLEDLVFPILNFFAVYMNIVAPFLLNSDVRSKAFQAVDQFLQIVKQYHEKVCAHAFFFNASLSFCFIFPMLFDYLLYCVILIVCMCSL